MFIMGVLDDNIKEIMQNQPTTEEIIGMEIVDNYKRLMIFRIKSLSEYGLNT